MEITTVTLIAALAGATSLIKYALPNVKGWVTIAVTIALGALAGYAGIEGLNIATGILAALAASGTITAADRIGRGQE